MAPLPTTLKSSAQGHEPFSTEVEDSDGGAMRAPSVERVSIIFVVVD